MVLWKHLERLEAEADRRALEGVEKGVYYRDKRIATERQYSDNLLMFRAKKLDPSYRDNYSPVSPDSLVAFAQIFEVLKATAVQSPETPALEAEVRELESGDKE